MKGATPKSKPPQRLDQPSYEVSRRLRVESAIESAIADTHRRQPPNAKRTRRHFAGSDDHEEDTETIARSNEREDDAEADSHEAAEETHRSHEATRRHQPRTR